MSSEEPVEDPYLALGVAKDADISAIRSAHRKLVLKYHPDRLKGEAEQARGKDAFQKVQQAYELLSDPTMRSRYDNRVKLAQLKKEAARDPPPRTTSYPMRAPPPSTPTREYRDGRIYEEREPSGSYFEEGYRYREEETRTTSRKYDGYERERKPDFGQPEKERKSTKWPEKAANDLPFNIALKFKAKVQKTRETVKEKAREKETHASSAKSRDQTQKRERMDKQSSRRAYVEDDLSSSDSDTATYVTMNQLPPRSPKTSYDTPPRTKSRPEPTRRTTSRREEEEDEEGDKWHEIHGSAREYIERSQRPGISGRTSSSGSYWESRDDRQSGRKSGSDSDKRPHSSKGRGPSIDVPKTRPPPMPSHSSAPVGVAAMKAHLDKDGSRSKQRSSTGATSSRGSPKEVPTMSRSQTMPSSKSRKSDAVPARGSNLKHAETHDSGYGSSGGQTPDLSGTSPPRHGPTRYQIVEDEDDVSTILVDPEDRHRRTRSPSPPIRERDRRDRPQRPTISTDTRPRSSRGASYQHSPIEVEPRSSAYRQDSARSGQPRSGSPRESPSLGRHNSERSGKLFGETERDAYTVRYPNVKMSPRVNEKDIKYSRHSRRPSNDESDRERDRDYFPYSHHREALRSPPMGLRRGSVN
jgi:curved DNA-binding protein CbpA